MGRIAMEGGGRRRRSLQGRTALLFAAYALQNTEETLFLPGWLAEQRPDFVWPGPVQYAVAAALLTLCAALVIIVTGQRRYSGLWGWLMALLAGALAMNALTHLLMSVATFSLMPGVVTGVLLQGPLAAWVLMGLVESGRITAKGALLTVLAGLMVAPLAAGAALRIAEALLG